MAILVRITGAKRILEIGTLGGYSTIWMARALSPGGLIFTLEENQNHASVAHENFRNAGVSELVDLREGPAIETLTRLKHENTAAFDFIFIDADKPNNPHYLAWALQLSCPGTVIIADNMVREGRVTEYDSADANVLGTRRFTELLVAEPRLSATTLQTVGLKGYDGFTIAVVLN